MLIKNESDAEEGERKTALNHWQTDQGSRAGYDSRGRQTQTRRQSGRRKVEHVRRLPEQWSPGGGRLFGSVRV